MAEALTLAIDTSHLQGSVAVAVGKKVKARALASDRRHAAELMPTIAELLHAAGMRTAEVKLFAYSCGPGSFTGLRVAATIGRMLQSATDCAVVAVPTLEVIARNALNHPKKPKRLAVVLDARRGEVFGGVFERQGKDLATVIEAGIFEPADWLAGVERPVSVLGSGVEVHREVVEAAGVEVLDEKYWTPRAEEVVVVGRRLAAAGKLCEPNEIVPHYLRRPECEEVYEKRRAEARRKRGE